MAAFGAYLEKHHAVASTMPLAHALAMRAEVASGAAVWADEQTAGRGRAGRRWESPPGRSLMVSFMLRRAEHRLPLNRLVMIAALGAVSACRSAGLDAHRIACKWPNDIVWHSAAGAPHKLAGILIESQLAQQEWVHAVVGIGINVNQARHELPEVPTTALAPASLRLALAEQAGAERSLHTPELDRDALFVALCRGLETAASLSPVAILAEWQSLLWQPPGTIQLTQKGTVIGEGAFAGTDDDGNLRLRGPNGDLRVYESGDLSLRALA